MDPEDATTPELPGRHLGRAPRRSPALGLSEADHSRFLWQRARLLSGTTLSFAIAAELTVLLAVFAPGAMTTTGLGITLSLILMHLAAHVMLAGRPSMFRVLTAFGLGQAVMLVLWNDPAGKTAVPTITAVIAIAGWGLGSVATILVSTRGETLILAGLFAGTLAHLMIALHSLQTSVFAPLVLVLGSWAVSLAFGIWLNQTFPRIMRRISGIGGAYLAERQGSEREAQRHRDARLLHDTVLATLTLLAHSGRGVDENALRAQAASDGKLLERLRTGEEVHPQASGDYLLTTTEASAPDYELKLLRERFERAGLTVAIHGSANLSAYTHSGQAILLALAEALENVRRHAGVSTADVTLSETDTVVRAVVTDSGVGFDPNAERDPNRLGMSESIIGRVGEVGGTARVFSAPGAGTTIMLEVPR
ncbi:signal transduction histidine kinase [Mycetocola sp. BIGb0189]|uniref:sensor histidine kinase n=1 Tax=Mycetocola sp. BIGb0189 TaxID=2940604 RepID=UPI0021694244|nr:ATP-binding protein [Mycetocola sp. BIGb0189]MCS4276651.1 signal transduction histidine kinase [Mycetocola sp. BIGb0189]